MADGKSKDVQRAMVEMQGILFRMSSLTDNLENSTRDRLGGPMTLNIAPKLALVSAIESVVAEVEQPSSIQIDVISDGKPIPDRRSGMAFSPPMSGAIRQYEGHRPRLAHCIADSRSTWWETWRRTRAWGKLVFLAPTVVS